MEIASSLKVLFVCLGNICRSPLAKIILQEHFRLKNISASVDSCGTGNHHQGAPADKRSILVAQKYGLSLDDHVAKPFVDDFFVQFDWIFAMDHANLQNLHLRDPQNLFSQKIRLFREFDTQNSSQNSLDVPDPYHGGASGFELVYQMLVRSSIGFCDFLRSNSTSS